jgi:hypothetical protein
MGTIIGGLIPAFLVSRLFLWAFRRFSERTYYIPLSHILSLIICVLLWGFGTGRGGFVPRVENIISPGMITGLIVYAPGQAVWTVFDYWRAWKKRRQGQEAR